MVGDARRLGSLHPTEEEFCPVGRVFFVTLVFVFQHFNIKTRLGMWTALEISLYRLGPIGVHTVLKFECSLTP